MRRPPMIPQIQRPHLIPRGEISPRRLPVTRRTEQPMKNNQRRLTGTAQITMKKWKHAAQ